MKDNWEYKICGTCLYHKKNGETEEYLCTKENSNEYGHETEYDDHCIEWSKR